MALRVFPVASEGSPHFVDDFATVRPGATKGHGGIDIFADQGAPVLAVDDGAVTFREDPIGGHVFYLRAADGDTYYGAHLSAYGGAERSVAAGDVIGYVGMSGNAKGTTPHLHFEWHPSGAAVSINPFRALSALMPQSVTDVRVMPAPEVPPDPLPRLAVVPGPVPPIPYGSPGRARRRGGAAVVAVFGLGALALASKGRR